ncbi:hypothetical protein QLX08_002472 [Tetragonisca angustula]|uniref:Uncharacterized protein n=1 Tax=Tetragonisca angustula TaxID=166442 RepID=A0AAW1AD92_9HYME
MKVSTLYVALCAYAYSSVAITITHVDNPHGSTWKISEDIETSQRSKEIDDEPVGISFQKKLIPIKEPRIGKNFQTLRIPLEPDAEILPAHYTGIKPPGVDHMELRHTDTRIVSKIESPKNFEQADTQRPSEHQESDSSTGEKYQKDDTLRKTTKTQREETDGERKLHEGRENDSNKETEQIGSKGEDNNKEKDRGQVDRKVAGYRNIYHKDEYKKDHDFYENDDHGGRSKKHGKYREKYVASEGAFNKGSARDSGFDGAELRGQGISGESRAGEGTEAHETRNGHDGFFKNFHGFREAGSQKRR